MARTMEFPRWIRVLLVVASVALAGSTLAQSRFSFDIPAQPASEAIRALARQSGLQVAALTDDLSGIRTNAVRGVYAPMEALKLAHQGYRPAARRDRGQLGDDPSGPH